MEGDEKVRNNVLEIAGEGELKAEGGLGDERRQERGWQEAASSAQLLSGPLPTPPSPAPLAPPLPLLSHPLAQGIVLLRAPRIASGNPVLSAESLALLTPGGQVVSASPPYTHAHTHAGTHTRWTQHKYTGLRLQDPRWGCILSLAFRAQPAPETALGQASLRSRHCLKENGGTVPTWRASGGICLSAHLALTLSPFL